MNIGRYFLSVVVAFLIYGGLYTGTMMGLFASVFEANAGLMRPETDNMAVLGLAGHFIQTIIIVLLYDLGVGSNDIRKGMRFGLIMGAFMAATDMTVYGGLDISLAPLPYAIVIHLVVGAVVGMALAKIYRAGDQVDAKEVGH